MSRTILSLVSEVIEGIAIEKEKEDVLHMIRGYFDIVDGPDVDSLWDVIGLNPGGDGWGLTFTLDGIRGSSEVLVTVGEADFTVLSGGEEIYTLIGKIKEEKAFVWIKYSAERKQGVLLMGDRRMLENIVMESFVKKISKGVEFPEKELVMLLNGVLGDIEKRELVDVMLESEIN